MGLVPPRPILPQRDLPISPYTGESYDPEWGTVIQKGGPIPLDEGWMIQRYKPFKLRECWPFHMIYDMAQAIGVWFRALGSNIATFMNREDDDLDSIRSYSPYLKGYQPTDTPPPQLPPQGGNVLAPAFSDEFQVAMQRLAQAANAGKISMLALHQEIEPYIPPAPLPTYDIVMPDAYEMSRVEDEPVQQMIPPPQVDESLISRDYY